MLSFWYFQLPLVRPSNQGYLLFQLSPTPKLQAQFQTLRLALSFTPASRPSSRRLGRLSTARCSPLGLLHPLQLSLQHFLQRLISSRKQHDIVGIDRTPACVRRKRLEVVCCVCWT
jgi:hypothetical protein